MLKLVLLFHLGGAKQSCHNLKKYMTLTFHLFAWKPHLGDHSKFWYRGWYCLCIIQL